LKKISFPAPNQLSVSRLQIICSLTTTPSAWISWLWTSREVATTACPLTSNGEDYAKSYQWRHLTNSVTSWTRRLA